MFLIAEMNNFFSFHSFKRIIVAFIAILLVSCSESPFKKNIDKGIIEYTISYPQIEEGSYLLDLMPKKMETIFAKGNFRSDIVAGMGLFKTSIIYEKDKKELVHSVKMLNKKYASTLNIDELKAFNPKFQEVKVTSTEDTKEIAGLVCKGVIIEVLGDSSWTFEAYYTDEIGIKNPNQHTPFKEIDGVLMEYEILSYDTHMKFTANAVSKVDVKHEDIVLEEGYSMVNPEKLKSEIEAIFATVK